MAESFRQDDHATTERHRDALAPSDSSPETKPSVEESSKTTELARKTREFEVLRRVSSAFTSTLDLEEICDIALRTMDELFEFHHANILLVEPDGETLAVVASHGYENQALGGRIRIGTGVIGVVAQKRKMLHVSNLGQKRAYAAAQRQQMMKSGRGAELGDAVSVPGLASAESQIAIPLVIRDELIGVFSIESPLRHTFSEHDRGLVSIVANQIASAIHNARLFEQRARAAEALQVANASLEARVAERTAALERELSVAEALLGQARNRVEGPLLGESLAVRELRDAIAREAAGEGPLLLVGPPGAGKEAAAHALHKMSGRRGAFIFVSCPELYSRSRQVNGDIGPDVQPELLLLAEQFDLASGGTLFLDAVDRMPLEFQHALQELLQDGRTLSSDSTMRRDVRVIASATPYGWRQVENRKAPWGHLLSARRIDVPALADRRQDIAVLVDRFVQREARQLGKVIDGVSTEAMRRLEAYAWPGNIRELRSVLERAILVSRGTTLDVGEELLDQGLAAGSYRLVARLGAGGMGEVWSARHRLLARPAAVKLIRHDVSYGGGADEDLVRRFQREARVTSALRSPHTVQLYDFGVNDTGSFYYVMELLEGFDLNHIVTRFGPQPWQRVIVFLHQACLSLAEAHAQGLVHRDIKPANLFVTRLGSEYDYLKVLDFGIVKDRPGHDVTALSAQDILQGTPAFMPPERVVGEGVVDGRADLYSLACTAYWALTGEHVFKANSAAQILIQHVQTPPAAPSTISELPIPSDLEEILMQCLEKNPSSRPASAIDLDQALMSVPVDQPWTQQRARSWWERHAPDVAVPHQT